MKLKEYLEKERIDPVAFAVQIGISVSTIYRIMRDGNPTRKTAYKIEKMTGGKVRVEELFPNKENIA